MSIDAILNRALDGQRISMDDAVKLYESDEVEKIGDVANQIMKKWHPDPVTTFVIGRNVNYTNFCDTYCSFCAFYRPPNSKEGYVLDNDEGDGYMRCPTCHHNGTRVLDSRPRGT